MIVIRVADAFYLLFVRTALHAGFPAQRQRCLARCDQRVYARARLTLHSGNRRGDTSLAEMIRKTSRGSELGRWASSGTPDRRQSKVSDRAE